MTTVCVDGGLREYAAWFAEGLTVVFVSEALSNYSPPMCVLCRDLDYVQQDPPDSANRQNRPGGHICTHTNPQTDVGIETDTRTRSAFVSERTFLDRFARSKQTKEIPPESPARSCVRGGPETKCVTLMATKAKHETQELVFMVFARPSSAGFDA